MLYIYCIYKNVFQCNCKSATSTAMVNEINFTLINVSDCATKYFYT